MSEKNDHPVQVAWIKHQVLQCAYCQSGEILNAVALLESSAAPIDQEIDNAMRHLLCRSAKYPRIREAINHTAQ